MSSRAKRMLAAVRWREWYASKVPFVWTACAVAAATSPLGDRTVLLRSALIIAFTCFCGAFGHLANDLADRGDDLAAGKPSAPVDLHPGTAGLLAVGCAVGAMGALVLTNGDSAMAAAGSIAVATAAVYSLPPVRLKRRGAAGVWCASAAQRTLPALTAFAALGPVSGQAWAFAAVAQLAGIRAMLVHQIADEDDDRRTGTATYVVRAGGRRASRVLRWLVLPLEVLAVVIAFWFESRTLPGAWLILAVGALGVVSWPALSPTPREAYSLDGFGRQPLIDLYQAIWPLGASAALLSVRPGLWPLGAAFVAWESRYLASRLRTAATLVRARLRAPGATALGAPVQRARRRS